LGNFAAVVYALSEIDLPALRACVACARLSQKAYRQRHNSNKSHNALRRHPIRGA
jgi:hypothetical protein